MEGGVWLQGSVLKWLRADHAVRRQLWRVSEVWRPEAERWMTRRDPKPVPRLPPTSTNREG
jgi:hypothetical protein